MNTANGSFLTENTIQGNSLDVIDLDKASESQHATAPSKAMLNNSFSAADHGSSVLEGFGARDVAHHERSSGERLFKFDSNSTAKAVHTESVDSNPGNSSLTSDKQSASGIINSETTLNADSGAIAPVAAKAAVVPAAVASNAPAQAVSTGAVASAVQAGGFPDATNTGVKAGASLTKFTGTYYVTQDNAVISNMEIHGQIVIQAKNVTMTNIKLVANTWHALWVQDGSTGFTLQDSEIDGSGSSQNGVLGQGTFLRNDIHGVENGINVTGPATIRDNYIYGLQGGPDAHYDGIEINAGHNIDITHNTVINSHDQAAAVMMNNEFGGLSNINIDGNRLVGGGYTVYLDGRKGGGAVDESSIKITNNQIGGGQWGKFAFYEENPVVYGNTPLNHR